MKKSFKLIIIILSVVLLATVLYFLSQPKLKAAEENLDNFNPVQGYKDTDAYVNEVVENFFEIYSNLVNNKEIDLSYLSDVVDKDSPAIEILKRDISSMRDASSNMDITTVDSIIERENESNYKVQVTIDKTIINKDNSVKKERSTLIITLTNNNGYKIVNYSTVQ